MGMPIRSGRCRPEGHPERPIVGMGRTYDDKGLWLVGRDGHVYDLGDARSYGSLSAAEAGLAPVAGMAVTPNGKGYWLVSTSGHVYTFGDATNDGSPTTDNAPYDAIGTRNAGGYIVTSASNGAMYLYPGGNFASFGPGSALSGWLVGTAMTPSGNGAWEAGADGGVETYGQTPKNPIVVVDAHGDPGIPQPNRPGAAATQPAAGAGCSLYRHVP